MVFVEPGGSLMNESFSPKDILKGLLCVPFWGGKHHFWKLKMMVIQLLFVMFKGDMW